MLDELTYEQLQGWIEYAEIEPFNAQRDDLRTAIITQTIHSQLERLIATNALKYRPKFKKLEDFMIGTLLNGPQRKREPLTVEQWKSFKEGLKRSRKPVSS